MSHKGSHWGAQLGGDQIPTLIPFSTSFRWKMWTWIFSNCSLFWLFEKLWRPWAWPSRSLKNFHRKKKRFSSSINYHINYRSVTKHCERLWILCQNQVILAQCFAPAYAVGNSIPPWRRFLGFSAMQGVFSVSQSGLHVAVVSLSVTVPVTSTNNYTAIVPIRLNLCTLHSWGLVAFHSPWTWVNFQNSSQVQSLSFLHCCCSFSLDPALTSTSPGFSFASKYIGWWNNCPPPLPVSTAFIKGQRCCSLMWFSVSISFDD